LLAQAALYRDPSEKDTDLPPPIRTDGETRSGNLI